MPIQHLEIRSFKSIVKQDLALGQMNVFIGPNGSGKSNLLEAIGVLSAAMTGELNYAALADRGVRLSAPDIFKSSFRNLERKKTFSLLAEWDRDNDGYYKANLSPKAKRSPERVDDAQRQPHYQADIRPNAEGRFEYHAEQLGAPEGGAKRNNKGEKIFLDWWPTSQQHQTQQSTPHPFKTVPRFLSDSTEGMMPAVRALNDFNDWPIREVLEYAIYSPSTPILRGVSPDVSRKEPLGLYGGGLANAFHEMVSNGGKAKVNSKANLHRFFKLLTWANGVDTTTRISSQLQSSHIHTTRRVLTFKDKYMKTTFNDLYAYDVSEGALYVLFVLVLLLHHNTPNIFALDNVDTALNPSLVRQLMRHIIEVVTSDRRKQVFMTTHNPTALDAIDLFDDSQRLFVVERNSQGHTEISRVRPPKGFTREQWIKERQGMNLSEMWLSDTWLSGALGGLPEDF